MIDRLKVINFLQDFGCAKLEQLQKLFDAPKDNFKDILNKNIVSKKGDIFEKCYESWKKYAPDFEIIEWNEANCDVNECAYVKEAYENKKWAYVADYFRIKILKEQGGIYVDTDIEFNNYIHKLILNTSFFAFETN